jgi:hypothetical protein
VVSSSMVVWSPDSKSVVLSAAKECHFVIDFVGIYW